MSFWVVKICQNMILLYELRFVKKINYLSDRKARIYSSLDKVR